jgi:hypothetical protein
MVIAFDIDGTITRNPPFFAFLTQALVDAGHRVLIITFRESRPATEADLASWGIVYDQLITSSLDLCMQHGVDGWKAAECRKAQVEIFFEDDPDVLARIDPSTLCLQPTSAETIKTHSAPPEVSWLARWQSPGR